MFTNLLPSQQTLQIFLGNFSFCILFLAMICYWIDTAFTEYAFAVPQSGTGRDHTNKKSLQNEPPSTLLSLSTATTAVLSERTYPTGGQRKRERSPIGALQMGQAVSGFTELARPEDGLPTVSSPFGGLLQPPKGLFQNANHMFKIENFANLCMVLVNVCLVLLLLLRWQSSGHFPLSNLYESLLFLCWSCTSIHILLLLTITNTNTNTKATNLYFGKLLGSITSPCALFINAYATFSLPKEMQSAAPLVPALQSNWLMMHVTVMILSYSALILGSLLAIAFLIVTNLNAAASVETTHSDCDPLLPLALQHSCIANPNFVGDPVGVVFSPPDGVLGHIEGGKQQEEKKEKGVGATRGKQILAKNLDNLSYRILGIGFPFLTIGILSGAVWANEAWGSYWSWDPKETWAFLTWLVFAIYLHMRLSHGWEGKKPAVMASFGFLTVWFCFLGVNLLGEGLHSYGWISN